MTLAAAASSLVQRMAERPTPWVVALGLLLFLPSLSIGFFADDWMHLAFMEGMTPLLERGPLDLFTFINPGEAVINEVVGERSPWWTEEGMSARFFRPLTSATHQLDYFLYGRQPLGYHVTSLLLFGLLLAVVMALYRELGRDSGRGPEVALLAGLLYAVDDAHGVNVAWIANRSSLLCAMFVVGALL